MSSMQYHQKLLKGKERSEPHVLLSSYLIAAKDAVPWDGGLVSEDHPPIDGSLLEDWKA